MCRKILVFLISVCTTKISSAIFKPYHVGRTQPRGGRVNDFQGPLFIVSESLLIRLPVPEQQEPITYGCFAKILDELLVELL